jgi:hypothetical protein
VPALVPHPALSDWLDQKIAALRESVEAGTSNGRETKRLVFGGRFGLIRLRSSGGQSSRRTELRSMPRHPQRGRVSALRTLRLFRAMARSYASEVLWYLVTATVSAFLGWLVVMAGSW